jgi:hypothetical protein
MHVLLSAFIALLLLLQDRAKEFEALNCQVRSGILG